MAGDSIYAKVSATNFYGESALSTEGNGATYTTVPDAPVSIAEDVSERTRNDLKLTWSEGTSNGGLSVMDFRISQRFQGDSYQVIASGISQTSYTIRGLYLGAIYEFKVEARNTNGYGSASSDFTILHAIAPDVPSTPTTANSGTNVVITWSTPLDNGSTITSYTVTIMHSDGSTYTEDLVNCDGSDSSIVSATQCTIPLSVLTYPPYFLSSGDYVLAKVLATNVYGSSEASSAGSGATII